MVAKFSDHKNRELKQQTLHMQHAFLYISWLPYTTATWNFLTSRACFMECVNTTQKFFFFSKLRCGPFGFNPRKFRQHVTYLWIWRQTALSSTKHNFYFPHSPSFSSRIKKFSLLLQVYIPPPPTTFLLSSFHNQNHRVDKCKWRRRRENHRNVVVLKTGKTW